MRARATGAATSALVHLVILAALFQATDRRPPPPPKHTAVSVADYDEPMQHRLSGKNAYGLACTGYRYRGIGIVHGAGAGRVIDVGAGTPAEKAGLLAGDVLLNGDILAQDRYAEGTELELLVLRDGRQLRLKLIIETICNE